MNREQMIEKAARALWAAVWPQFWWDSATEDDHGPHLDDAEAVLDAILPQVTTVEGLEALPEGAIITNGARLLQSLRVREYEPNTWFEFTDRRWFGLGRLRSLGLVEHGPWTVVWQP